MAICYHEKQIDIRFSCICPVIDHKFCHNIFKVVVGSQADSKVDPDYFDNENVKTKVIVNDIIRQMHGKLMSICFL